MARAGKPWRWRIGNCFTSNRGLICHLTDGRDRERATIWQSALDRFTWHTWNDMGTGGENSSTTTLNLAKDECIAALVRQGWAPGGWKVTW